MPLTIKKEITYHIDQDVAITKDDKFEIKLNDNQLIGGASGVTLPADGKLHITITGVFEG